MKTAEKLKGIPFSGEYEEIIFDLPEPWRKEAWNYVKFTQSDGNEWCGAFREKLDRNFLLAEISEKSIACVVSGGHGYIIDIEKKEKIKDIPTETIIDLFADQETKTFYFSTWWTIAIIDTDLNELKIDIPIVCDGIFFRETKERKLSLEIEEINCEREKHLDYFIDLNERKIKKNVV